MLKGSFTCLSKRVKITLDAEETDMTEQMLGFVFVYEDKTIILENCYLLFNRNLRLRVVIPCCHKNKKDSP